MSQQHTNSVAGPVVDMPPFSGTHSTALLQGSMSRKRVPKGFPNRSSRTCTCAVFTFLCSHDNGITIPHSPFNFFFPNFNPNRDIPKLYFSPTPWNFCKRKEKAIHNTYSSTYMVIQCQINEGNKFLSTAANSTVYHLECIKIQNSLRFSGCSASVGYLTLDMLINSSPDMAQRRGQWKRD